MSLCACCCPPADAARAAACHLKEQGLLPATSRSKGCCLPPEGARAAAADGRWSILQAMPGCPRRRPALPTQA
eukprot:365994-Chlamydomonas_euryale.AAC.21